MTSRAWRAGLILAAVMSTAGCRKAGPHAGGTGYGVGIPRVAYTIGNEPQAHGASTQGVSAPTEAQVGRIRPIPAERSPPLDPRH
jgi:hypothetical protein